MVQIKLGQLIVQSVSKSSGVFSGDNYLFYWRSSKKVNQGFGDVSGDHGSFQGGISAVKSPGRETWKKE